MHSEVRDVSKSSRALTLGAFYPDQRQVTVEEGKALAVKFNCAYTEASGAVTSGSFNPNQPQVTVEEGKARAVKFNCAYTGASARDLLFADNLSICGAGGEGYPDPNLYPSTPSQSSADSSRRSVVDGSALHHQEEPFHKKVTVPPFVEHPSDQIHS